MRFVRALLVFFIALLSTGCTVAHFTYIRNLSDSSAELTFVFDQTAAPSLQDSVFIPYSLSSHLINGKTYQYLTDSIVARKSSTTKMKLILPSGGMIMFDKNTSRKVGYHDPSLIEVAIPGKQMKYELVAGSPGKDQKQFKSTGAHGRIYWHDIY